MGGPGSREGRERPRNSGRFAAQIASAANTRRRSLPPFPGQGIRRESHGFGDRDDLRVLCGYRCINLLVKQYDGLAACNERFAHPSSAAVGLLFASERRRAALRASSPAPASSADRPRVVPISALIYHAHSLVSPVRFLFHAAHGNACEGCDLLNGHAGQLQ